jgi:hypothetical protein
MHGRLQARAQPRLSSGRIPPRECHGTPNHHAGWTHSAAAMGRRRLCAIVPHPQGRPSHFTTPARRLSSSLARSRAPESLVGRVKASRQRPTCTRLATCTPRIASLRRSGWLSTRACGDSTLELQHASSLPSFSGYRRARTRMDEGRPGAVAGAMLSSPERTDQSRADASETAYVLLGATRQEATLEFRVEVHRPDRGWRSRIGGGPRRRRRMISSTAITPGDRQNGRPPCLRDGGRAGGAGWVCDASSSPLR